MKRSAIVLILLLVAGCSREPHEFTVLASAMHGERLASAREIKHRQGGMREQVDEFFFRADPSELKVALSKAGFVQDDSIPRIIRGSNSAFRELVGSADRADALGFKRANLAPQDGKYCHLLCAPDFSWVYLIYVDSGRS